MEVLVPNFVQNLGVLEGMLGMLEGQEASVSSYQKGLPFS